MITEVPMAPWLGVSPEIIGVSITAKLEEEALTPLTVTVIGPIVAPTGTGTMIWFIDQFVGVAAAPLNETVLVPWVLPNPTPVMVTDVPTAPSEGERPLIAKTTAVPVPLKPTKPKTYQSL